MVAAATTSARAAHLIRTFQAALAALDDFRAKSPAEAAEIYAHVAAHMRSAAPMAFASLPVEVVTAVERPAVEHSLVSRRIGPDGAAYELGVSDDDALVILRLWDVLGEDALVALLPAQVETLREDLASVKAQVTR